MEEITETSGLDLEVVLRMVVVKRLYNFSYQQTERFVNDSIVLRQFSRL